MPQIDHFHIIELEHYNFEFQDVKTRKRHEKIMPNLHDVGKLFEQLPDYIYFTYQDPPQKLPPHINVSSLITVDRKKKIITKMLWLLSYAKKIIDCSYTYTQ